VNAGSAARKRRLAILQQQIAWGEPEMIRNPYIRRAGAIALVVLGAILMLLAAEVWQGALLLALGVVVELVGITLEHRAE